MRHNKRTIRVFLLVHILLLTLAVFPGGLACGGEVAGQAAKRQANPYANADLTIRIIPSVNGTFGYDILLQEKPFVHQPSIPALPGNEGFKTRERAQRVAELVVKKIRSGEIPPTVSVEELNSMGVMK